ncbi:MAG: ATP-dependent RNA helicase HrpA, partial [Fibrobacter sp.]|nr:ATP-dependent RNA helicase HrpA [Fibrobacter sp.]
MKQKNTLSPRDLLRPFIKYTDGLPILERKVEILDAIIKNQVVIIAGETGSGKTTQLPVICLEAGRGTLGKIGCTQPRRIAAISIANRVAEELKSQIGREVGYKIRFNDHDSPQTCIKFMTDGILLTEIERDPQLSEYDTLIIDEAHERSLNIDFILGYLRKLLPKRPDLKVIISSATIDTDLFSRSFNNAPVIEVSGRMYPVEVLYLSEESDDEDTGSYIDSAVKSVEDLLDLYNSGDMLVFMPTERDIREACERLKGLKRGNTVILPLFARLSRQEQESIFKRIDQRKIVVATNIAETSITVPGIRFVIDTGLARISRYVPRLRTNRLPIEPVSKAAADQRMGRCGRVMDGVCIRLYSEKEYLTREPFTQPEIKRSNLAGVILSMIAHKLGDIEEFMFLEPPARTAISEGYAQLRELGAIDDKNRLTDTGRQMSRLPLDPHIARIVLAAKNERALREIKIIAAALSIVDPRERPFDKQNEADTMHKRFTVPGSDFLTYVKLWDTYRQEWSSLKTQNKMRKFCKDHFLSYTRMQEWFDVHQQIHETLSKMKGFEENTVAATPDAVHRSLLPGLLSNCARKNEQNKYRAARGKELIIFPGSSLYGQKPEWIVCHEMIETSQLFAHTVAPISPQWLEEVAAHLCTRSYSEPWFDSETGVVRATERVSLFGLEINVHSGISFGKVNKDKANEVFIWQGLVEEQLQNCNHKFYTHNKNLRKEIESLEAKLRTRSLFAGEVAIADFYRQKLSGIGSIHDLNKFIKNKGNDSFLMMKKEDILTTDIPETATEFPDKVSIGGKNFTLDYVFNPGSEKDGITLKLPQQDASFIPKTSLEYLVPALWPAKIEEMLRSLPKELRKKLMPISEKAKELAQVIVTSNEPFEKTVSMAVRDLYNIDIESSALRETTVPEYLQMRVEVCDRKGNVIASGRGANALQKIPEQKLNPDTRWQDAFKKHEKHGLTEWNFGTIPEQIDVIANSRGIPLYGYPALKDSGDTVDLLLFKSKDEAEKAHRCGVKKLIEIVLAQEFAWIERDCKFTPEIKLFCNPIGGADRIKTAIINSIREYLLSL